ncbi:MAG: helix-turn-helix transcriptional regulator [Novosphingobium sp.]|nr:helix-turn-helix transcriptional regulator [Novosphingobium sp.]
MTETEHMSVAMADLTDRELEILRLLTAGHTVKSIAVLLGRSEASINERLRDARRKTGIGSSRELARRVDAQKNWDRKIEVPLPPFEADEPAAPSGYGRFRSKGMLAMLIVVPLAAAIMMIAADPSSVPVPSGAPSAQAAREVPLAGRWSLDVSRIPAEERPRRVTITFRVSADDMWTTLVEIEDPDGSKRHAESKAALDGVPVPVTGNMDFIDTVSLRKPAPDTLVMTLGKNGAPVSTRVYTVAADRKSMTETIVWSGNGMQKQETTTFIRAD